MFFLTLSPCADAPWKPVVNGSMVALEGDPVTIFCSAQSSPEPTITIFKDKKPLAMGVYQSQVELDFESVSHEDDGEYWCTAENQFGQSSIAFNLTVECKHWLCVPRAFFSSKDLEHVLGLGSVLVDHVL